MRLAVAAVALAQLVAAVPALAQVQVRTLAPPDLFSVGTGKSDLPSDLWDGSSGALAKAMIPGLGARPLSAAGRSLARHVLSAGGNAPEGVGDDADLAGARAQALLQLGDAAGAEAITDGTPNLAQKTALSQVAAEAALIRGEEDKACGVGDALAAGRDGNYWLRLRAYCQARAGQTAPAQLTLDLTRQQDHVADFARLMDAMLAGKDAGAPALDDGLDYALSRRTVAAWGQGLAAASAPVAVAVARDPMAPPAARIEAEARAMRLGLPVVDVYAAVSPPPADVASADQPGAAGEAGLLALASTTTDLTIKEAAIIALLRRAKDPSELQALASLADPSIVQLIAAKAVLKEPALFAQTAAAAGDADSAKAARAQVGQGAPPPSPADLALLDALIAAVTPPPDASAISALDTILTQGEPPARARAGQAMSLLAALGAPVGAQVRFDLSSADLGATKANAGRLTALDLAARAGRMGDVALYALAIDAEAPPEGLSVADRAALVKALAQAGLKSDARAYAIDGLMTLQAHP